MPMGYMAPVGPMGSRPMGSMGPIGSMGPYGPIWALLLLSTETFFLDWVADTP